MIDADDIVSFPPPDEPCPQITIVCDHLTAVDLARIEAHLWAHGTHGGYDFLAAELHGCTPDELDIVAGELLDKMIVRALKPHEMSPAMKPEPQPHGWYRQFEKRRRRSR